MPNSIKNKVFFWIITFALMLMLVVSLLNHIYSDRREDNIILIDRFEHLENKLLRSFYHVDAFFRNEVNNPSFFITGESENLKAIDKLNDEMILELALLKNEYSTKDQHFDSLLLEVEEHNRAFVKLFNSIVESVNQRGYKDFGIEGSMRINIHQLEDIEGLDQTKVLTLRRHEKDYIIRHEQQYVDKLNQLADKFSTEVIHSSKFDDPLKDSIVEIIQAYKNDFNQLVRLDQQIGIYNNSGLKRELDQSFEDLSLELAEVILMVSEDKEELFSRMRMVYLLQFCLAIILAVFVALLLSNRLTKATVQLAEYIASVPGNDFNPSPLQFKHKVESEIQTIYSAFNMVLNQLKKREQQRDEALDEVKQQEARFRHLAKMLPIGVFETNADKTLIYANNRFEHLFGIRPNRRTQSNLYQFLKDEKLHQALEKSHDLNSFETKAYKLDGQEFPVLFSSSQRVSDNSKIGLRGIVIDITDRVNSKNDLISAKEKAEESDRLKSAFLANMSHEIRTPMNSILGFSDLLLNFNNTKEEHEKYLHSIQNSGRLLLKLINDIIDISRIEAGKIEIFKEQVEVDVLLNELLDQYKQHIKAENKNLSIELEIPHFVNTSSLVLYADLYRLRQVLMNLLNNAIKFTDKGGIRFGYQVDGSHLIMFVEDTGIGIEEDHLDQIFERFRQSNEERDRMYGGTGLGLAISKNLIQLMGGDIYVDSEIEKGSTFTITLPIPEDTLPLIEKKEEKPKPPMQGAWKDKTILIVEDDKLNMQYIRSLLQPTDVNILMAFDGKHALKVVKENSKIDLVMLDIHLPVMNGYVVARKIRETDTGLPIVAQTAYAMIEEKQMCLKAGCNDYLAKPYNASTVFAALAKYLN